MIRNLGRAMARAAVRTAVQRTLGRGGYYPRRRRSGSLISLIILGVIGAFGYFYLGETRMAEPLPTGPLKGRVVHVADGDTFHLGRTAIRIWGIDAPERDTPFYEPATHALRALLHGQAVTCTPLDRSHERIVARCLLGDGRDVGEMMVRSGWAKDLPQKSGGAYHTQEQQARQQKLGMWTDDDAGQAREALPSNL